MAFVDVLVLSILGIIAIAFVYSKFGEQLGLFWQWVKGLFSSGSHKIQEKVPYSRVLTYD